jgi:hypothetical protein
VDWTDSGCCSHLSCEWSAPFSHPEGTYPPIPKSAFPFIVQASLLQGPRGPEASTIDSVILPALPTTTEAAIRTGYEKEKGDTVNYQSVQVLYKCEQEKKITGL